MVLRCTPAVHPPSSVSTQRRMPRLLRGWRSQWLEAEVTSKASQPSCPAGTDCMSSSTSSGSLREKTENNDDILNYQATLPVYQRSCCQIIIRKHIFTHKGQFTHHGEYYSAYNIMSEKITDGAVWVVLSQRLQIFNINLHYKLGATCRHLTGRNGLMTDFIQLRFRDCRIQCF